MRWINITILITLTILMTLATTSTADTLRHDSIGNAAVFTISAQEWLEKVGIVDTTRARGPYLSDSCFAGDHQLPIPFVQNQLAGRPLAFFSIQNVVLKLGDERQEDMRKDILVVFDTLSRQIVYSTCSGETRRPEHLYPKPETKLEERQLQLLDEAYVSIPDIAPQESVLSALRHCRNYPLSSQSLDVYYVMYSYHGATPIPAWVINMRGLAPWAGSGRPHYSATYQRIVIDANSGEQLMVTNAPYQLLEPDSLDPLRWR